MSDRLAVKGKATFLLLWMGISALAWFLAPINALQPTLRTYLDVANRALAYAVCGLIIGLVMGFGQFLVLKQKLYSSKNWFFVTLAGCTLALLLGLAISTLIPAISFTLQGSSFLPLREPTTIFFFPFPMDIYLGGWVVGIAQWIALRQILPYRNFRLAALWVFGVWLSIGLGIIAMLFARTTPVNVNSGLLLDPTLAMERVYIGVVSGLVTGILLLLVIHQVRKKESTNSPLSENKGVVDVKTST
ncbi:MAG: hypothetical protein ABSG01_16285 [Anaerolineales bacterium]|jgi:hypothetical protein